MVSTLKHGPVWDDCRRSGLRPARVFVALAQIDGDWFGHMLRELQCAMNWNE